MASWERQKRPARSAWLGVSCQPVPGCLFHGPLESEVPDEVFVDVWLPPGRAERGRMPATLPTSGQEEHVGRCSGT